MGLLDSLALRACENWRSPAPNGSHVSSSAGLGECICGTRKLVRMLCDLRAYAKGWQDARRLQGYQVTVLVCVEASLCYTALELL